MSKVLGERMARVETKLEVIEDKIDCFIEKADKRYAPMWLVKVAGFIFATALTLMGIFMR